MSEERKNIGLNQVIESQDEIIKLSSHKYDSLKNKITTHLDSTCKVIKTKTN